MSKAAFEIKEVLSLGWEAFKKNALILIVLTLIIFIANFFVTFITGAVSLPAILSSILSIAVGAYFMLSAVRATYAAADGQTPSWDVLKNDWKVYLRFTAIFVLLSLIFVFAAILLLIPLLFAFALFLCVPYIFAANPEIGILEIFKKSWKISIKHVWLLILYVLLCLTVIFVTAIFTLGLGILITTPLFYVTSACVYKKLEAASKETPAAPAATAAAATASAPTASTSASDIIKK